MLMAAGVIDGKAVDMRTHRHVAGRVAIAVVVAVSTVACGGLRGLEGPASVATYSAAGEGGDGALLEGTLVLDGQCTYVVDGDGTRWLPIFVDVVRGGDEALTYGATTLRYDSEVALAGGESTVTEEDDVPGGCAPDVPAWRVALPPTS
jgi:hypothetical protein